MSERLEAIMKSILIGKVPQVWLEVSYPSMRPIASYIEDLCHRLKFFYQWSHFKAPVVFWFSGFFFPQSFLTAIMQNYARKNKTEIDKLKYRFIFKAKDPADHEQDYFDYDTVRAGLGLDKPLDGALISGLYLDGARWNFEGGVIDEMETKVLFSQMPIIHLLPCEKSEIKRIQSGQKHYKCPLYKTMERWGQLTTTGHSSNFIMTVYLPMDDKKHTSAHWVKRGAAMLC